MDLQALKAPFSPTLISWRVGATSRDKDKGIALAYLNARDVMERLDEVCGAGAWQCRYPFQGCCEIAILIEDKHGAKWVSKANGAGQSDIEAEKGQYSDAFKRAAVLWGIGRYLYDLPNQWYPIESYGKSYRFTKEAEAQMTQFLHKWQYSQIWEHSTDRKKFIEAVDNAWANKDSEEMKKIFSDMTNEQQMDIWSVLKEFSAKRASIKQMLGDSNG